MNGERAVNLTVGMRIAEAEAPRNYAVGNGFLEYLIIKDSVIFGLDILAAVDACADAGGMIEKNS